MYFLIQQTHDGTSLFIFLSKIILERRSFLNTELKNSIAATDKEAQYDESAKRLLSQKIILAHILAKTVPEFTSMNPTDIVPLIEGEPYISSVPVDPGLSNIEKPKADEQITNGLSNIKKESNGQRIIGLNDENIEINEGMIRFDIIFYVRIPLKSNIADKDITANNSTDAENRLSQIIINVEAQKSEPQKYDILNRAIFYVSRMISSQKGRDFENSDYNNIKQVYSIWVCMNMPENSMSHIHLLKDDLIDKHNWHGNLDLLNIIMVGLSNNLPPHDDTYEMHRLLSALLSKDLTVNEKLDIIGNEYDIPVENNLREDVNVMCNLSQGIKEDGIAIGEARGIAIGEARGRAEGEATAETKIVLNMHNNGLTPEQIAAFTNKNIDDVKAIIAGKLTIPSE